MCAVSRAISGLVCVQQGVGHGEAGGPGQLAGGAGGARPEGTGEHGAGRDHQAHRPASGVHL